MRCARTASAPSWQVGQRLLGVRAQRAARRGQRPAGAASRANSGTPELGLQPPDLLGHRRLLEQQLVGRAGERAVVRGGEEVAQLLQGHNEGSACVRRAARTGLCRMPRRRSICSAMITQRTARPSGPAVPQAPRRPSGHRHRPARSPTRVSEILLDIERGGEDALRRYSRDLDGWDPPSFELTARADRARRDARRPEDCKRAPASARASAPRRSPGPSARRSPTSRSRSSPGVIAGHRLVPVGSVGAYLPAGRVPLLASPFMTVLVPKVAGVETVVACAPPPARRHLPVARLQHRALRRRPHLRPRRRPGARGDGVRPGRDRRPST